MNNPRSQRDNSLQERLRFLFNFGDVKQAMGATFAQRQVVAAPSRAALKKRYGHGKRFKQALAGLCLKTPTCP